MKTKKIFLQTLAFLFLSGVFALYSCVSTPASPTPQKANTNTRTPSITPSNTSHPFSLANRPTRPPVPPPPGFPPTFTPLPTYPPEQARQVIMNLYENSTCQLPCWWGIVPGETSWREAWQFVGRFAKNKLPFQESQINPGYAGVAIYLNLPETEDIYRYLSYNYLGLKIDLKTSMVSYIDVNTGTLPNYTIPQIFKEYGQPEQIYAFGSPHPVSYLAGVELLLYYPEYGFISTHGAPVENSEWKKPTFEACFQRTSSLYLWPPEEKLSMLGRLRKSQALIGYEKKPIEQVSDFRVETLYKALVNLPATQQPCIRFNSSGFLHTP